VIDQTQPLTSTSLTPGIIISANVEQRESVPGNLTSILLLTM
jgi:hypothetical protein